MGDTAEFTKRVYMSEVEGSGVRGRPLVKWESRVEECMWEREMRGLDQVRRECRNRKNLLLWPLPWGEFPEGTRYQSYTYCN